MVKFTVVGGDSSSDLAKRIARKIKSPYIKTEKKVFPDGESKITINQIPKKSIVFIDDSNVVPGSTLTVQIEKSSPWYLEGSVN